MVVLLNCEVGISSDADGSACFQQGNTKVILVSVYGPHEAKTLKRSKEKALVNCQYQLASFSSRKKNSNNLEMASILRHAFESVILTEVDSMSQIDIFFLVLSADGGILSCCMNAGTLALIDASIPIRDYLCGCCSGFVNETPIMDINYYESLSRSEINLGMLKKSELIVVNELTGRMHGDVVEKIEEIAKQGCRDIYAIMDAVVRKHMASIQMS